MSKIEDAADSIFNDSSRTLAPEAVASQVALMSIVSIVTVLLFNLLRPKNKIIYEPKVKYHEGNKPPPRITSHLFGWLPPLAHTKEPELLDKIGLDAVAFLRFNRLLRQLFSGIVLLTGAILIPINVTYNLKNVDKKSRDLLSMLTIRDVQGDFLYAHVATTYLITILIMGVVWYHWTQMIKLRHQWFRSPEYLQSFYARTLQVIHVPKKYQSDNGLKEIFDQLGMPYPTTSVHIGRKVGKLPELIEYHNQTVREFEQILVRYLKGGKIKSKRPTIRIGGKFGCGGVTKDAIDFYTAKLKRTEAAIEEYRNQIDTRKAENYGFASLAAVPYAHIVAQKLEGKHPKGTTISLAPNPKDIVWSNMNKTDGELARKKLIGVLWLVLVCFFNTLPLFVISALANMDAQWFESSPKTFAIVSGVLPATVSGIFGFFLPIVMRWLTKYMGALTYSRLDRAVIARYFAFLIISQLIIFTLIGVLFNSVKEIIKAIGKQGLNLNDILAELDKLPGKIHTTYINQASYWLTFYPLRGFLVVFDLAQIINLVWLSFKTHVFGRTPRDIREWTQPPEFQYAVYYSNLLFMSAVGLVFAPLAPLVALAACCVFWMGSWVYKYQLMFVYVSKVESGGRIWNVVINRLLFCVLLMQSLMVLTIGLQKGFRSLLWLSALPPVLFIIAFKFYINAKFIPAFRYFTPTEEEIHKAKVHSERADHKANKLEKRFGHPALHMELFTPMLHAKMMPLLTQVYSGKIKEDKAHLDEYGGQKMAAQIVPGGIRIAAINQADLEYDPVMYQRDRGELDWDQRSISSTNMLDTASTLNGHYTSPSTSKLNDYLHYGPTKAHGSEFEMTPVDSMTDLLDPRVAGYHGQGFDSHNSLARPPSLYQQGGNDSARDLYRPQDRSYSPSPYSDSQHTLVNYSESQQQHQYPPQHTRQPSGNMLANYQPRTQSPSPYARAGTPQQYPPQQQHGRASPGPNQAYQSARTPSPGPYQALGRTSPGPNQAYTGRMSPGPNQAYGYGQQQQTYPQHGRQPSGNMLNAPMNQTRSPSPMGQQAYPPQQHVRQQSGNMLHQINTQVHPQQQQQQHLRSPSADLLSAHGHSPVGSSPSSPSPYSPRQQGALNARQPQNHAGRGAFGHGQGQ
ncbi:hypothetical protein CC1G_06905 [Coprinopsis cinerea okayama7|uniref:DUF221-domain-containing protein n=1 Tax=Coprinopsis cinerea (strain Okayama-7 / 130 / ATCC MYA-4618 / FGSC 9003) TaxID=240176 RepID=A8N733_COPC7|nr:hypothetical protein CC1G_06905 [Coprinopsis cinerea okayama7\|eukprot:XP_001830639.2 hypothetical protein CC1G_06905 [Coprinopsis cinerea okayama7\